MSLLSVKNVSIKYNTVSIIENISFELEKKEILSIVGPNGSGKSTLVKALLSFVPYTGDISYNNCSLKKHIQEIGYVPQHFNFDKTFPISVKEFIHLFPQRLDLSLHKKICSDIKIDTLLHKKLGTLSGGELQRVLIAQAILKKATLLILDEPTAGVDIEGTKNFYELLNHINKEHGVAIILISHEIGTMYKFSDKVLFLNEGTFCFGKPAEVLTENFLQKVYGKNIEFRNHSPHEI